MRLHAVIGRLVRFVLLKFPESEGVRFEHEIDALGFREREPLLRVWRLQGVVDFHGSITGSVVSR
jgi:hypothetical protein